MMRYQQYLVFIEQFRSLQNTTISKIKQINFYNFVIMKITFEVIQNNLLPT